MHSSMMCTVCQGMFAPVYTGIHTPLLWTPGGCLPQGKVGYTPPRGQTDMCKNITFAKFADANNP